MDWGIKNRLSQIIKPETGRTVMLAVDHGYFLGPTSGLEDPQKTITPLLQFADSIMLTRGTLRNCVDPEQAKPVILRASGGSSVLKELSNEEITTSIQEAIRLNVAAVTCSIFVGAEYEKQSLMNLSRLINEAETFGIPVLAVTAVGKEMVRDARYLALSCRIAAEMGAHLVKTYYCADFEQVVDGCFVPVVVAGGKKTSEKDALKLAENAIRHGAIGVDMGRNIFQCEHPVAMIQAVRSVVHEKISAEQAYDLFQSQNKKPAA